MAGSDFIFNIARGAMKYYYYAAKNAVVLSSAGQFTSAAGASIILVPLETTSIETDSTLSDYDDLAALIAGSSNEQTNQARKSLTLATMPAPDDTNSRLDLDLPDTTYTALGGNAIGKILVCFKPDTGSADSAIIPLLAQAVSVTPDGNDVVVQIAAAGFYRSQ
jgi:hypothetical protein